MGSRWRSRRTAVHTEAVGVHREHEHSRRGDAAREVVIEGERLQQALWDLSMLRLNQLGLFDEIKRRTRSRERTTGTRRWTSTCR